VSVCDSLRKYLYICYCKKYNKIVMKIKKRTLNELRQTKDSHYAVPRYEKENLNSTVAQEYIKKMKEDDRMSQISIANFVQYLTKNNLRIVKD